MEKKGILNLIININEISPNKYFMDVYYIYMRFFRNVYNFDEISENDL